jgi:hypothetical protein
MIYDALSPFFAAIYIYMEACGHASPFGVYVSAEVPLSSSKCINPMISRSPSSADCKCSCN